MKSFTVRLPEKLIAEIEAESRRRKVSRSDLVRERLEATAYRVRAKRHSPSFQEVAGDLIGSVKDDGGPRDLSARVDYYLRKWGYGQKHHRR